MRTINNKASTPAGVQVLIHVVVTWPDAVVNTLVGWLGVFAIGIGDANTYMCF